MKTKTFSLFSFLLIWSVFWSPIAEAARFSGGVCASQGSWLQDALKQSRLIVSALETLKNDPACKVLVSAIEAAPKVTAVPDKSVGSFANVFRELSALNDFMNPSRLGNGMENTEFQRVVFDTVFNKSYSAVKEISNQVSSSYTEDQKDSISNVSERLRGFLQHSEEVANITMSTARGILNALPDSEKCLHNKPSAALAVFGAVAHSAAALISGGEINGVGEFASSLLNYSRDMKYMKSLKPLEMEEFKNSVYCLIESTSESYCAVEDAQEALGTFKKAGKKNRYDLNKLLEESATDPIASPLAGLMIYMRDIPVVQGWLEKVLMGLAPRTSWQGQGKNENWQAYLGFIQSVNTLQANFRDKEQQYNSSTSGKDRGTKLGRVREILNDVLEVIRGENRSGPNFFGRTLPSETDFPFFLLGQEVPIDFNSRTNSFDNFWTKWSRDGIAGFDNPDRLVQIIRDNLWKLMAKAQLEANALFASRMLVDPQNLVTEAMRGPGISAYQAFYDQRSYYQHLILKLDAGAKELAGDPKSAIRARQLRSYIPLLKDSVDRLNKVIEALDGVADVASNGDYSTSMQSEKIMNVIYEAGNMLVSWDSFFGVRMQSGLQADLSDTLWRKSPISDTQKDYLYSVGPEIVGKLAGLYANNPVAQRSDLSAAKLVQITNLESVETQFSKVLFYEILNLDCKLEGGFPCKAYSYGAEYFDPADDGYSSKRNISWINDNLVASRNSNPSYYQKYLKWWYAPTDDAYALVQIRAKLCMQSLSFKHRDAFKEVCRSAVLESEFSDKEDHFGLNLSFDDQLAQVNVTLTSNMPEKFDAARTLGVCSYRTYLRKNHVFFMNQEFSSYRTMLPIPDLK